MNSSFTICPYVKEMSTDWDELVLKRSVNGTFLQSRNFLNYHPKGRFIDASLVIKKKNRIVAVLPACEIVDGRDKELYSHKGSTYGGLIIDNDFYHAEDVINMIKLLDDYAGNLYKRITMKITADIHSCESSDLLQYALEYCGYSSYSELNTYVDLQAMQEDVILSFDRNKKRNIKKCEEHNLIFKDLQSDEEIEAFYELLSINLEKYDLKPVHTSDEMKEFLYVRIPDKVRFYGVLEGKRMMAGGMMFVFDNANVIHAQNLSADYRFNEYSPITYMYYRVIKQAKGDGYKALSWGISTENEGKKLNFGLIRNKESYGSKYQLNKTYFKKY